MATMTMLSRIADNLFWLHRYMERTDGLILTLRNTYILSFDIDLYGTHGYHPLLQSYTVLSPDQMEKLEADIPKLLNFLVYENGSVNSMKTLVGKARENARGSQDKITKELWEQVNAMHHYLQHAEMSTRLQEPSTLATIDFLQQQCLLYNGVTDSTMPRGLGWSFMNIGKYIERCLQTINLTDNYFSPIEYQADGPEDLLYWRRLLLSLSGYELYLKSNRSSAHSRQVLNQVIMDKDFPRSVLYSLIRIEKYLRDSTEDNPNREAQGLQKQFGRLLSMVEYTDINTVDQNSLPHFLHSIRKQTWDFSAAFSKIFFSYT
jgi:uncharacterized alpha-E superfamily protein